MQNIFRTQNLSDEDKFLLFEQVCLRPRMFYPDARDIGDVLAFIMGISCGFCPPHGSLDIADFVNQRYFARPNTSWTSVLMAELATLPFEEACATLHKLFRDFRISKTKELND